MRRCLAAALAVLALAAVASARPMWNGAGWYQIEDVEIDGWIYAGPFDSEVTCKQTLPPDDEEAIYYCTYLATKPAWDY